MLSLIRRLHNIIESEFVNCSPSLYYTIEVTSRVSGNNSSDYVQVNLSIMKNKDTESFQLSETIDNEPLMCGYSIMKKILSDDQIKYHISRVILKYPEVIKFDLEEKFLDEPIEENEDVTIVVDLQIIIKKEKYEKSIHDIYFSEIETDEILKFLVNSISSVVKMVHLDFSFVLIHPDEDDFEPLVVLGLFFPSRTSEEITSSLYDTLSIIEYFDSLLGLTFNYDYTIQNTNEKSSVMCELMIPISQILRQLNSQKE